MLWERLLTAAVGIPVALWIIYTGGWWLAGATALLGVLGLTELYRMTLARWPSSALKLRSVFGSVRWAGYGLAMALPIGLQAFAGTEPVSGGPILACALALTGLAVAAALALPEGHLAKLTHGWVACVGTLALPALFSYLVVLRNAGAYPVVPPGLRLTLSSGACRLFVVFAATWGLDTAAYAVGRKWGKRKLCPKLSPGKTVEGAIGGLAAAVVITCGLGWWFGLGPWHGLVLGVILGVVGQLGDLAESKLKRWAGVKDSGALLPGHGGVLDRFDSLLLNAPAAYYYLRFTAGG